MKVVSYLILIQTFVYRNVTIPQPKKFWKFFFSFLFPNCTLSTGGKQDEANRKTVEDFPCMPQRIVILF